jgi:antitoxin component of RelBE/YafQ-DinJ toxin-antitoxin module
MGKEIISFRVSKELKKQLVKEAKNYGLTLTEYCYMKMGFKAPQNKISFWKRFKTYFR